MHPENGLHVATEAKNMTMVWDPLPSEFTIRSDDIYDQLHRKKGPDSVDGTVTRYRLEGPGIESQWGARFSAPIQTGPGAHPSSCKMGTWSFPEVKAAGT